jgi:lysophospholipase L1-like esterase
VAVPVGVGTVLIALALATTGTAVATALPPVTSSTTTPTTTPGTGATTPATSAPTTTAPPVTPAGPPVRVLLMGDSIALTLGEGLSATGLQDKYGYVLSDKGILGCGVVMGPEVEIMGARDSTTSSCDGATAPPGTPINSQPWPYQWLNAMAIVHPNVVVLLAGRWEVVNREYKGTWTNILHPAFATYVKHQLELTSDLVTASGAHMVYLTAPCTDEGEQPDGAPWPEDSPTRLAVYNKLVRQVAAEHPQTDSVVDLNKAACPGGKYAAVVNGVTVRTSDGVHFTIPGGEFLAPAIMPAIVASGQAQAEAAARLGAG